MATSEPSIPQAECPLPNTHRRLEQAHRLWHQALEQYSDPDGFRTNLNSAIEALRTTTFMLQGEKGAIPGFDDWYGRWQAEMKADPLMKWLSDARTTVIHRSDLETQSVAVATIHNNLNLAQLTCEVPPLLRTREVAAILAGVLPQPFKEHRKDLLLSIERRWCVTELAEHELLEALAHVYGFLSRVVADAHGRAGMVFDNVDDSGQHQSTPDGRMPCMITTRETRTVRVRLEDQRALSPRAIRIDATRNDKFAAKSAKRYGIKLEPLPAERKDDPFALAESMLELAKVMLRKDKHLDRTVFLITPSGMELMNLRARDRTEKYALMRAVAEQMRRTQASAFIDIGEAWTCSKSEVLAGRMPEVAKDRGELIYASVLTKTGAYRAYSTPFSRGLLGTIKIGETTVDEGPPPTYLAPILEVWNLPFSFGGAPGGGTG
jgi:hypothetical protein